MYEKTEDKYKMVDKRVQEDKKVPLEWGELSQMLLAAPWLLLIRGFTLMKIWQWFVVPIFGLPSIGIAEALGLALLLVTIMPMQNSQRKFSAAQVMVAAVASNGLTLLIGFILSELFV